MSQDLQLGKYEFYPHEFNRIQSVIAVSSQKEIFMDEKLKRLIDIGFIRVGSWDLAEEKLSFDLSDDRKEEGGTDSNALYAFVVDRQLKYIGKTVKGIWHRMSNYRNAGKSQLTNTRNRKNILDCLHRHEAVDIYVLPDNGLLHYGGFHINLAAGLEDSLIEQLAPPWNGGQKETEHEELETVSE